MSRRTKGKNRKANTPSPSHPPSPASNPWGDMRPGEEVRASGVTASSSTGKDLQTGGLSDVTKINIENLREALRQVQWSLTLGLTASLSLVLLQISALAPGLTPTPGSVVPVDPVTAKLILGAVHIVAGFLAQASILEAIRIANNVTDSTIKKAALDYPSFATSRGLEVRTAVCLLPPLLFVIAVVWWAVTASGSNDWTGFVIFAICFGVAPYCGVAYFTRTLIPAQDETGGGNRPATGPPGPSGEQDRGAGF
jgi:hypothetical protein